MLIFDHIAIACVDLDEGVAWAERVFGVAMHPGGKHAHFGTHNALLGMGDLYLEVIALDPNAASTGRAAWFGLDDFTGPPRLCNWICQADGLALAPDMTGPALPLSRGDLHWQITVPEDGSLPKQGGFPTLLRWGDGIASPAARLPDNGVRLKRWQVSHPEAECLARLAAIHDPRVHFVPGRFCLTAVLDTPNGIVTLTSH